MNRRAFCVQAAAGLALAGCGASTAFPLPATRYFLFGEGDRRKLLYKRGTLTDLASGEVVWRSPVAAERYRATHTAVEVETGGRLVSIREDESGIWVGKERIVEGGAIRRPDFAGHRHAERLRALHHEILVNIVGGKPLPNLIVYRKAWRRDAAMMAMCLAATGNLDLIRPWVLGLKDVFEGNANEDEPDNIGQTLYLLGLVGAPKKHPLVEASLEAVRRFRHGDHIAGITDNALHPDYQTLWLKSGLKAMGLPDPYRPPWSLDHYRSLVWWAPKGGLPYPLRFGGAVRAAFPYLAWAEAHYWGEAPPALPDADAFPQTWEADAGEADYARMKVIGTDWADARVAGPHGWHAAEAFLYLLRRG